MNSPITNNTVHRSTRRPYLNHHRITINNFLDMPKPESENRKMQRLIEEKRELKIWERKKILKKFGFETKRIEILANIIVDALDKTKLSKASRSSLLDLINSRIHIKYLFRAISRIHFKVLRLY